MALFDIFKKKKGPVEKKDREKEAEKPGKVKIAKKAEKTAEKEEKVKPLIPKEKKKLSKTVHRALKAVHISEKATDLTEENQYVFKIWPRANKTEVRKAVQDLYGVYVEGVKIIKVPARKRRVGRIEGRRKGYRKAVVKIKEGQKIEVLPR